ncbi:MAG: hypothetical protein NZM04_11100 [Methylacidiphilales bacterium]|nr:hypothetical protein [Candidatus Methylacidiphilales bacterium]
MPKIKKWRMRFLSMVGKGVVLFCGLIVLLTIILRSLLISTKDVSNQEPFKSYVGKDYMLMKNVYLYRSEGELFLGDHTVFPILPQETSTIHIGANEFNYKVLDVIQARTIMRLEKVVMHKSAGLTNKRFLMRIKDGKHEGYLVNAIRFISTRRSRQFDDLNRYWDYHLNEKYIKPVER